MPAKVTAPLVRGMKAKGTPIVCVTAYDYTSGQIADAAGVDVVLVGDSVGNVFGGHDTTVPVTLEQIEYHVAATKRGVSHALLVADLPFGSYEEDVAQAVRSAVRLAKAGAEAVKLEGSYTDEIRAIARAGLPVMGHVGMTPQSVNTFGGFRVQGRNEDRAEQILTEACQIEEAGAFAIVLELIPAPLAAQITSRIGIPTIGIGAGPDCDGQIQVFHDVMGLGPEVFRHAKRYAEGRTSFVAGLEQYAAEVREGSFPTEEHSF